MFSVMIAAAGVREGAVERALLMSVFDSGEPVTTVRTGQAVRLPEVRTKATAV